MRNSFPIQIRRLSMNKNHLSDQALRQMARSRALDRSVPVR